MLGARVVYVLSVCISALIAVAFGVEWGVVAGALLAGAHLLDRADHSPRLD